MGEENWNEGADATNRKEELKRKEKRNEQDIRVNTSSTAQGGGGSFKNRKPIGEVGCCESGMAERSPWWNERWLISLTISLSFSDYLPTYLSIYLFIYLPVYLWCSVIECNVV